MEVVNLEKNHRRAVVVQDLSTQWIQAYPCKTKTSQETQRRLQKFLESDRNPKVIYTDNSLEFGRACEDLSWNHCMSTPHRSETNEIAERAVRRVKEGTSAVLSQSGLDENWWTDSMECCTYLRNVTDLLSWWEDSIRKTFWETLWRTNHSVWFIGWELPYLCERPVKNPSIWKESLTWIVPWIRSVQEVNLEGDIMVADIEELETMDASEIYSKKKDSMQRKLIFPKQNGQFIFPSRRWKNKICWRRSGTENIQPWYGNDHFEEKVILIFLENQKGIHLHHLKTHIRIPVKQEMTSGPCHETSFSAIILNPESNFTRREKNHSLLHWNTLTFPELLIQTWMLCKKAASMTIGISMDQEICLVLGQVSLSLLHDVRNLQMDICGPVRDWQNGKRHPGQIIYGQNSGEEIGKNC